MLSILTNNLPEHRVSKRRLIVMEDYYHQINQYFKLKKKQNLTPKENVVDTLDSTVEFESDLKLLIEKNQILYSELLTQKLINKKF